MISFLSREELTRVPGVLGQFLTWEAISKSIVPSREAETQAKLWQEKRLLAPPLHVLITDTTGTPLGRTSLAPLFKPHMPMAYTKTWRCFEFCVFQGARPSVSYGLYAACFAAMREIGVEELLDIGGRDLLLPSLQIRENGTYNRNARSNPEQRTYKSRRRSQRRYDRLLDLAGVSAIEMELYICNSAVFDLLTPPDRPGMPM